MKTPWVPQVSDTFADRLLVLRWNLGLSQRTAAGRADISPGRWRDWEKGALPRDMSAVAQALAEAFGVDREWLIFGWEGIGADALNRESAQISLYHGRFVWPRGFGHRRWHIRRLGGVRNCPAPGGRGQDCVPLRRRVAIQTKPAA